MKVRIISPGYGKFNGYMGPVLFENGVSVNHVSEVEARTLGTLLRVENVEDGMQVGDTAEMRRNSGKSIDQLKRHITPEVVSKKDAKARALEAVEADAAAKSAAATKAVAAAKVAADEAKKAGLVVAAARAKAAAEEALIVNRVEPVQYKAPGDAEVKSEDASSDAENAQGETDETPALPVNVLTRSDLETIADAQGINGLREIGDRLNVKARGIKELIDAIVDTQGT